MNSAGGNAPGGARGNDGYGLDALAFGAHPDDVELFCGGTMIRLTMLGYSTGVIDLTRGEMASHGTPEQRAREAQAAAAVIGLRVRENLALPDTGVDSCSEQQLGAVVAVLRRLRPELVLIPWVEERHPDHAAAGQLLLKGLFLAGLASYRHDLPPAPFKPRQVLHYPMRVRVTPSFVVDISSVADRKAEAIACHESQVNPGPRGHETLIGSSLALSAIEARDRYYGSQIGVTHGEPLRAIVTPGLIDPIKQFRDNPFPAAHAFEPAP